MFGHMIEDYEESLRLINDRINQIENDKNLRLSDRKALKKRYNAMQNNLMDDINAMKNWGHEKARIKLRDFIKPK